eukprot:SAG22_NODE_129_length_18679_cov_40.656028_12_plen_111_part_00
MVGDERLRRRAEAADAPVGGGGGAEGRAVRGEATVLSFKGSDHRLSLCFSAFPCGSTALTEDRCNQEKLIRLKYDEFKKRTSVLFVGAAGNIRLCPGFFASLLPSFLFLS